ncbi:MAG: hypothetical protein OXH16_15580 [Gemmatimonadetes bacterium]|nr:hypothetical protein [Gemmatimonadota bacterium]
MKEERMKVLEMIQDGKITAEDAMRLLDALGDTAEEPQGQGESRQRRRNGGRQRRRRRSGGADIQVEVQERIREAQETLRDAMPRARRAVREAMPDVNRIVREATRSIPDVGEIVQEAMQTASEAVAQWTEGSDRKYPEKVVRQFVETTPIQVSDRLSVRTPKGHVTSKIWDRDEVQIDAKISVWGTDEAAVKAFAEQIDIQIRRESGAVQIRPNVPKRKKDDPVRSLRIDFELRHPEKVDLDVRASRGNITLPQIDGAATLNNNRGKTVFEGASGNIRVKQNRGDIAVQHAGGDFIANNNRGSINVNRVGGRAVAKNNRGATYLKNIAGATTVHTGRGAVEIENPEAGVMIQSRGGNIAVRPHKPIDDDYAIQNKDGAVDLTIPDGSAVDVHGYVGRGSIQTNLPLSITGVSRTSQVVTGQLNGGGSKVAIELGRGDLRLYSDEDIERDAPETPTPPEPPDPPETEKK